MTRKPLGRTCLEIPEVGLGTGNYHGKAVSLRRGFKTGALFVDAAESYESEEMVRDAIVEMRDRVLLATKVSAQNLHHGDLLLSAEASLLRLDVDHTYLYQIHNPNPEVPIEETMGAMEQLVDEGKIRYIGVSNFGLEQLVATSRATRKHPIISNHVRYNLADRTIEDGLLQHCQANGIAVIAYSPLGRELSRLIDCDPRGLLPRISLETGRTIAQIAINWCLCKHGIVAIPNGNSVAHVLENCAASGWRLSDEHISLLNSEITFRRRGRLNTMIRKLMPESQVPYAKRCVGMLPRNLRRRFLN